MRVTMRALLAATPEIAVIGITTAATRTLALCRTQRPDVLVVGLPLPDKPITETVTALYRLSPDTRVVVVDAEMDDATAALLIAEEIAAYISWDNVREELMSVVRWVARASERNAYWYSPRVVQQLARKVRDDVPAQVSSPLLINGRTVSEQKRRILDLLVRGYGDKQIAEEVHRSSRTVGTTIREMRDQLGLPSRGALIAWARDRGCG